MAIDDLRTVKQIAAQCPVYSEASLRWLIFRARENGLDEALVRSGRRVFIDLKKFEAWLEHGGRAVVGGVTE